MKKVLNAALVTGGIVGALTLNRTVTTPLIAKGLDKVGVLSKIPAWGQTVIADLTTAAHVVGGIAVGTAVGSFIGKKVA